MARSLTPWHRYAVAYSPPASVNEDAVPPVPPWASVVPFSRVTLIWSTREPERKARVVARAPAATLPMSL
ncbi:hypothetical protein [Streptomyces sp. B21-083]|uniref:hypothetical protein n=1 Tax=Streptomyces sp. B21-083 TaxID=3039410 RepID=UPI003FA73FE0